MEAAHEEAVKHLRSFAGITVGERYDVVVTHAGKVGVNHYQAAKAASAAARVVRPGGRVVLVADTVDPDPVGGDYYRALMTLLKGVGTEAFDRLLRASEWTFVPDQWEAQMWSRFFARVPPAHFFYFSPQTSPFEYDRLPCRLPGACAAGLHGLPHERQIAEFVRAAVDTAVAETGAELAHERTSSGPPGGKRDGVGPSVAFLRAGPYGIPIGTGHGTKS
jgi:SAM-dependent methyltransferase